MQLISARATPAHFVCRDRIKDQNAPGLEAEIMKAAIEKLLHAAATFKRALLHVVVDVPVDKNGVRTEIRKSSGDDKRFLNSIRLTSPIEAR